MAHFCKMNGNVVERVEVVSNAIATDESAGVAFLKSLYGLDTDWLQCSYNATIRKQYPGPGFTYELGADVFVAPRPFPSWTLDANHDWQPPTPRPDGLNWVWDEASLSWVQA